VAQGGNLRISLQLQLAGEMVTQAALSVFQRELPVGIRGES
jgi:hypothetical protein